MFPAPARWHDNRREQAGVCRPTAKQPPVRRIFAVVTVALLAIATVALVWIASEEHYRGCVEARVAQSYEARFKIKAPGVYGVRGNGPIAWATRVSVQGCHHRPF